MKVVIGGTFNRIHDGHQTLFQQAFEIGKLVLVGITSNEMAVKKREDVTLQDLSQRKRKLKKYLEKKFTGAEFEIEEIDDKYNQRLVRELVADAIVASEDKQAEIRKINRLRKKHNLRPLKPVLVPHVLAEDGTPIKATKIVKGEMDVHGKMLRPIIVYVGTKNQVKLQATRTVFSEIFTDVKVRVKGFEVESGVDEQPFGNDTVNGAITRARTVMKKDDKPNKGGQQPDFGVGIEAGLIWNSRVKNYFDVQYCAVIDKTGRVTIGHGSGFQYPEKVIEDVKTGRTIGEAMEVLTGIEDIGKKRGAIGYLSKNILNRTELTEQAVLMAMIPRLTDF
jgi:inosine/xanthosine triphosphatase